MKRMYATLLMALALSVGCGDGGGDTTDFEGVIASDGLSGTLSISVPGVVASVMTPSYSNLGAAARRPSTMERVMKRTLVAAAVTHRVRGGFTHHGHHEGGSP